MLSFSYSVYNSRTSPIQIAVIYLCVVMWIVSAGKSNSKFSDILKKKGRTEHFFSFILFYVVQMWWTKAVLYCDIYLKWMFIVVVHLFQCFYPTSKPFCKRIEQKAQHFTLLCLILENWKFIAFCLYMDVVLCSIIVTTNETVYIRLCVR